MRGLTYRDAIGVLLANAFRFCLALLEGMLVLELGTHGDGCEKCGFEEYKRIRMSCYVVAVCRSRFVVDEG